MSPPHPLAAICVIALGLAAPAVAGGAANPVPVPAPPALFGPSLGAASHFGQGWRPAVLAAAQHLGVRNLRDAVYWALVEHGGKFVFDQPETTWPDKLHGQTLSLTVNNGNPAYDGGATPYTADAVAAFARDAAATVKRFPAIDAVEVGNEFNGNDFVTGPVRAAGLQGRPGYYLALLRATHDAVKAVRPSVRIIGGAVHSIPVGYLKKLMHLGAGADMDALAIHPYSTPPEQLARQIAVLRGVPGLASMPIEVTEFGTTDRAHAPGYLLREYCQMALAGVTRAVWYPLSARGDGYTPLVGADGRATATGHAYVEAQRLFAGRPVTDVAPDPFTYACRFGPAPASAPAPISDTGALPSGAAHPAPADSLVIWGAPRALTLTRPDLAAFDASGAPLTGPLRLSETAPIVITGTRPFGPGDGLRLGPQQVVADSYDQFTYSPDSGQDGFERFARVDGQRLPFSLRPGQEASGRPWTPYLALSDNPMVRLTADSLLPGGAGTRPIDVVHAFTAPDAMTLRAAIHLAPAARSHDGVTLSVTLNGRLLHRAVVTGATDWTSAALPLNPGDRLEVAVGPGGTSEGDVTGYRITLTRAATP